MDYGELRTRRCEVEQGEETVSSAPRFLSCQAVHGGCEVEKLGSGQTLVEIELLGKNPDSRLDLDRVLPCVELTDPDRPGIGSEEPDYHLDGCGLSGAILAQ